MFITKKAGRQGSRMSGIILLTRELAWASGWDAANAQMRKAGRIQWSRDNADKCAEVTNKLLFHLEPPVIQAAMRRNGLVPRNYGKAARHAAIPDADGVPAQP